MRLLDAPFDAQPQEAVEIDWGHPLADGLVGWINAASLPTPSDNGGTVQDAYSRILPRAGGLAHVAGNSSLHWVRLRRPLGSAATLVVLSNVRLSSGGAPFVAAFGTTAASDAGFAIQQANGSTPPRGFLRATSSGPISTVTIVGGTGVNSEFGEVETWALRYDGSSQIRVYRGGTDASAAFPNTSASGSLSGLNVLSIGLQRSPAQPPGTGVNGEQLCYLVLGWDRALSPDEIAQVSANPWQLFRSAARVWMPTAAPAGASLAGSIAVTTTASGALSVPKPLAGTASLAITATGALTVAKPLAGALAVVVTTNGALAGGGALLIGSVAVSSTVAGALTVPKPLAGAVSLVVTSGGALTVRKPLSGAVAVAVSVSGALAALVTGGPGLVRASLTYVARIRADLTQVVRHPGDVTSVPRHHADLTHVARIAADCTYITED